MTHYRINLSVDQIIDNVARHPQDGEIDDDRCRIFSIISLTHCKQLEMRFN